MDRGQSEARPVADGLGREERLEHAGQHVGRDADAVVDHGEPHVRAGSERRELGQQPVNNLPARLQRRRPRCLRRARREPVTQGLDVDRQRAHRRRPPLQYRGRCCGGLLWRGGDHEGFRPNSTSRLPGR